ncbi:MAG: GAF domain-containing protein [Cyclobacteriaceae bacterium]|nr:GAF domain-containing protein [Cyclobacteriaceae bacterium]
MEVDKKAFKAMVLSGNKYFYRGTTKWINKYRPACDVVLYENPLLFHQYTTSFHERGVYILDEDFDQEPDHSTLDSILTLAKASQSEILYFTKFHKPIPTPIRESNAFVRVLSKSLDKKEFLYQLDALLHKLDLAKKPALRLQEKYLEAIIKIQNLLLGKPEAENKMNDILELIGNVSEACKVTLFENKLDYQERLLMSESYSYTNPGMAVQEINPIFNLLPYQPNYMRWQQELSAGRLITGKIDEFPNTEKPLLKTHGIEKLLLLPIIIKGNFWGFIMLSICRGKSLWSEEEIALIKSTILRLLLFWK